MIQYTIGRTYLGAINKLSAIRNQLKEVDLNNHAMIFILNEDNYDKFSHIDSLSEVQQYKPYHNIVANKGLVKRKK